jgi:hypothetical protein
VAGSQSWATACSGKLLGGGTEASPDLLNQRCLRDSRWRLLGGGWGLGPVKAPQGGGPGVELGAEGSPQKLWDLGKRGLWQGRGSHFPERGSGQPPQGQAR